MAEVLVRTNLWLIPALPLLAAGMSALARQRQRKFAASLAIASMILALGLSCLAFADALQHVSAGQAAPQTFKFTWFEFGDSRLELGWVLDPLTAIMLVMVSFVGLLIFIYSLGYMAHDENFTRFFCFLSLFAAAMLGLVIANNLLLLFVCWELVGLTSYLLIGFWYHKPSAAAAAKKAFITTRIGDLALLLGMVWLYSQAGTLLFYDGGHGCLEQSALTRLVAQTTSLGLAASTGIALLIFCGAIGKSGQVPLHVWLPDAMEGPTPVSALIHAATMVAAGVFLVARVYPLMAGSSALQVVAWVGAITAVFAASIAVAQSDIKRILAYSTVSQLGFMMLGLGVGGVAVGMFHLITHAFFKALLFMGAGSVIHGCHEEQDIRRMGGLRRFMPVTFATYAIGMMALSGVPILFSGFWSKDGILDAAHAWSVSHWPFYLGVVGAFLTAFYMTRQVCYVFFGTTRFQPGVSGALSEATAAHGGSSAHNPVNHDVAAVPHESPPVMTIPLATLAVFTVLLGFIGTPAWPWFQSFLGESTARFDLSRLSEPEVLGTMTLSAIVALVGIGLGWWLYGRKTLEPASGPDVLERLRPDVFALLKQKFYIDEIYEASVVRFNAWWAAVCDRIDRWVLNGVVQLLAYATLGLAWIDRFFDEYVVNLGFDEGCQRLVKGGSVLSRLHDGRVQHYLRILGLALAVLVLFLIWGCRAS
jgi:proton-translocating NADH-quinone oxidoreductase chain L